ncbi:MgtC/SapB family protein [Novosphingobium sp. JCM 18896]|uniref:MgtC/SapB family protein n=1 Tax=Novosphingobium sp. JCM 18896 TaxID=2989731 RepID=UPI0022239D52|nr:MgtC/SapB family protein [Novosphingobium sp. JCM 18896]MCW1432187.1 MgtC/SapB family protein [Novosphingobium sp. JCM 18896]
MQLNPSVPLHALDLEILLRLGMAAVLGLLLGLDRELRGHAAGMRTHGIICFSAAMMTVIVLGLYMQLGQGEKSRMDPLRIMEGTGAFVGIIAAGLIVTSGVKVHNLTTAVHMWLAAMIGIACGAAQWPLVTVAVLVAVIMLTLLRVIEKRWLEPKDARDRASSDDGSR